jgi:hypothetical protein
MGLHDEAVALRDSFRRVVLLELIVAIDTPSTLREAWAKRAWPPEATQLFGALERLGATEVHLDAMRDELRAARRPEADDARLWARAWRLTHIQIDWWAARSTAEVEACGAVIEQLRARIPLDTALERVSDEQRALLLPLLDADVRDAPPMVDPNDPYARAARTKTGAFIPGDDDDPAMVELHRWAAQNRSPAPPADVVHAGDTTIVIKEAAAEPLPTEANASGEGSGAHAPLPSPRRPAKIHAFRGHRGVRVEVGGFSRVQT